MLQSFLVVRESAGPGRPAHAFPAGLSAPPDDEWPYPEEARFATPEKLFDAAGLRWQEAVVEQPDGRIAAEGADAVLFCTQHASLLQRTKQLDPANFLPLLWWCEHEPADNPCELSDAVDGILFPGMTTAALRWSLQLASKQYWARMQWETERKQLLAKVEDRKWIDRAISILGEVKSISEAEAYEFLRKEATKERRRMSDVAVSIVKVYSLLREQYPRGRSR